MRLVFAAICLAASVAAAAAQEVAKAQFLDESGKENGSATLTQMASGVLIAIDVSGLPAGKWVAFHVHQTGTCDAMAHFDSAGGHFNPANVEHGYLSASGPHAGDMPNQKVAADGTLQAQVFNPSISLGGGANAVRSRALMIHAGEDDYKSQPAGNAGARLACAVIQ